MFPSSEDSKLQVRSLSLNDKKMLIIAGNYVVINFNFFNVFTFLISSHHSMSLLITCGENIRDELLWKGGFMSIILILICLIFSFERQPLFDECVCIAYTHDTKLRDSIKFTSFSYHIERDEWRKRIKASHQRHFRK